jgi:small-conductance mechanosensitive channel/CRP-like cAMP-binding protein
MIDLIQDPPPAMAIDEFSKRLLQWLGAWADDLGGYGSVEVLTAALLIVVLATLLPRGNRSKLRGPVVSLLVCFAFLFIVEISSASRLIRLPLESLAFFAVVVSIGLSLELLLFESRPARRWMPQPPRILRDVLLGLIYLGALLLTLNDAGVETASLVTGSALVTAALGFSMKDTLGNIFAGLSIQVEHPFDVGDWIQFDPSSQQIGRVLEINWRATKLLTQDEVVVVVPNSNLAQSAIRNFTKPTVHSGRSVYVSAPYDVPPRRVQQVILEAMTDTRGVQHDPPPSVVTLNFGDNGVEYWLRYFTTEFERRDAIDSAVRDRIWYAFQRSGIAIPYPVRDSRVRQVTDESEARIAEQLARDRRQMLRQIDFLADLPAEALDQLAAQVQRRTYADDERIIREGDAGDELFIIASGEVAVTVSSTDGTIVEVNRLGPRQFFGELSLLTGQRRSANITATQDCDLLVVTKAALSPILEASPQLAEFISDTVAKRQAQVEELTAERLRARVANLQDQRRDLLQRIREFFSLEARNGGK